MSEMDDIVKEFLVESYENLDQMDQDLIELEQDPGSKELLAGVFRTLHTIKGTCGFLAFSKLEGIAHVSENLLSKLRDGDFPMNDAIATVLLATVDATREVLGEIEATGVEGDKDYSELISTLKVLLDDGGATVAQTEAINTDSAPEQTGTKTFRSPPKGPLRVAKMPTTSEQPATSAPEDDDYYVSPELDAELEPPVEIPSQSSPGIDRVELPKIVMPPAKPAGDVATLNVPKPAVQGTPEVLSKKLPVKAPQENKPELRESRSSVSEGSVRVDVGILDSLMNLVGELVLARNQVLQFNTQQEDKSFMAATQRLNLITSELQEEVMKTRMQPIGSIWTKYPRVVRDLAKICGKQMKLEMQGVETELDKTLLEAIKDPLTHLVRNAVDHGIEQPTQREESGKDPVGTLTLRAYHEGGMVNVEIADDGGGIDADVLRRKGVQRSLITAAQAESMSDRDAIALLFLPGFSTAEKVTSVSGRGVGMDVVKTNIEAINGTIDVQTTVGVGSTFKIKIPLTLAIIPALVVACDGGRYAIPQVSLLELVRLAADSRTRIEMLHGAPVYRLRGELLPLVYLSDEFQGRRFLPENHNEDVLNIVVLQADDRQFGLVVDKVTDSQEIVVKPLSRQLSAVSHYAGATIMGDGKVALILDVLSIAQSANVVAENHDRNVADHASAAAHEEATQRVFLLCAAGDGNRIAVPLSMVARLEEVSPSAVEMSGTQEVVQYRGEIMPLLRLSNELGLGASASVEAGDDDTLHVIVYSVAGRSMGIVVEQILDIVEESVHAERESTRHGIKSSIVIDERVTDLLDLEGLVRQADPTFTILQEQVLEAAA